MGRAARERGYEYLAICDHTPAVGAVPGLTADDVRRQARGDRGRQRGAGAVPRPARDRVRHPARRAAGPRRRRARRARLGAGERPRGPAHAAAEMTRRVEEALRNPYVRCLSHPTGRLIGRRPENAVDLERVYELALEHGVAVEVNGLPDRLDLRGEHVPTRCAAGVGIVCSTDAHGPRAARLHGARRPHRAPRGRHGGRHAQHPPADRAARTLAFGRWRRSCSTATRSVRRPCATRCRWRSSTRSCSSRATGGRA